MPVVILLDVSLSMSRPVFNGENVEPMTMRQLAIIGINSFLSYLTSNCNLEFVSLIVFSSFNKILVPFTRDYREVTSALSSLEEYDRSEVEESILAAKEYLLGEWGCLQNGYILLITDGCLGLKDYNIQDPELPQTSSLPSSVDQYTLLTLLLSTSSSNSSHKLSVENLVKIINKINPNPPTANQNSNQPASVPTPPHNLYMPLVSLSASCVRDSILVLCSHRFHSSTSQLVCGHLSCLVSLYPASPLVNNQDIRICGFINTSDLSNPPFLSRHLILPIADPQGSEEGLGKQASFTVLLHGSLKVEAMMAFIQIKEDLFGLLYFHADSKKKSNLILSLFKPGIDSVPWLGNFQNLGPSSSSSSSSSPLFTPTNPVKKSYSQNCVVWIHNSGIQADIQKIIRNARKMPEKQNQFYKELNRIRKAALTIGFMELFSSIITLLEKELNSPSSSLNPQAALQIQHTIKSLKSPEAFNANINISPLV